MNIDRSKYRNPDAPEGYIKGNPELKYKEGVEIDGAHCVMAPKKNEVDRSKYRNPDAPEGYIKGNPELKYKEGVEIDGAHCVMAPKKNEVDRSKYRNPDAPEGYIKGNPELKYKEGVEIYGACCKNNAPKKNEVDRSKYRNPDLPEGYIKESPELVYKEGVEIDGVHYVAAPYIYEVNVEEREDCDELSDLDFMSEDEDEDIEDNEITVGTETVVADVKKDEILPRAVDLAGAYNVLTGGIMKRHVVPSNKSCLFASVYFALSNGDLNPDKSTELRKLIACVISENPRKYTINRLALPNKEYCAWIQNSDHLGGRIELAILSEHFQIEIAAVDTTCLKMRRFGKDCDYTNRILLIHNFTHYDPLVLELDNAPMQTIFPVKDDRPMEMAMEIARKAQLNKQYADICLLCGNKEATGRITATDHVEFGEFFK